MTTATDDQTDKLGLTPLACPDSEATHYAGCPCHELRWAAKLAAAEARCAELQKEWDAAVEDMRREVRQAQAAEARCAELERHLASHPDRCAAEAKCLPCRTAEEAESRAARYKEALREIRDELGVPQPGYPSPVVNAANIARAALAGGKP